MRSLGVIGSALAFLSAPLGLLVYSSLYNGMLHSPCSFLLVYMYIYLLPDVFVLLRSIVR